MSFKDLLIKPCYESGIDDIIEDFYVIVRKDLSLLKTSQEVLTSLFI